MAWSSWGPGLTSMDFFMWERRMGHLYAVCPRPIEDLVARLRAAGQRSMPAY